VIKERKVLIMNNTSTQNVVMSKVGARGIQIGDIDGARQQIGIITLITLTTTTQTLFTPHLAAPILQI